MLNLLSDIFFPLSVLGNDSPQSVEEGYLYEPSKRKAKVPPPSPRRSEL
jgi:hypothetical protein